MWTSAAPAPGPWSRGSGVAVHGLRCSRHVGSSRPRSQTVSPALAGGLFITEPPEQPPHHTVLTSVSLWPVLKRQSGTPPTQPFCKTGGWFWSRVTSSVRTLGFAVSFYKEASCIPTGTAWDLWISQGDCHVNNVAQFTDIGCFPLGLFFLNFFQ